MKFPTCYFGMFGPQHRRCTTRVATQGTACDRHAPDDRDHAAQYDAAEEAAMAEEAAEMHAAL